MSDRLINVTEITRLLGCDESYYQNKSDEYSEYTLYLVNNGTTVDGSEGAELQAYSDLYYGERKVTDLLIVNSYPGNSAYPNDKIYLVPVRNTWKTNVDKDGDGEYDDIEISPKGFNAYFKHDDIVTPISSSVIAAVQYDEDTEVVSIVWNLEGGGQALSTLISESNVREIATLIVRELTPGIVTEIVTPQINGLIERANDLEEDISQNTQDISNNRDEIDRLKNRADETDTSISNLTVNVNSNTSEIEALRDGIKGVEGSVVEITFEVSDLDERLDILESSGGEGGGEGGGSSPVTDAEIASLRSRVTNVETEISNLTSTVNIIDQRVTVLENQSPSSSSCDLKWLP